MYTRTYMSYIVLALVIFFVSQTIPVFASEGSLFTEINAQTDALGGEQGASYDITTDPRFVAARLIGWATSIIGFVFFFYMIYGGLTIGFSAGKEDRIRAGKGTIITGLIGTLVMLMAYSITYFITRALYQSVDPACEDGPCYYIDTSNEPINPDPLAPPRHEGGTIWGAF